MWFSQSLLVFVLGAGGALAAYLNVSPRAQENVVPTADPKLSGLRELTLDPIIEPTTLLKRGQRFELKDEIILHYAKEDALARFNGKYPGDHEKVINMEMFREHLSSVGITPSSVKLDFKTKEEFEAARDQWLWVDEKKEHHFILIMNHKLTNNTRQPFKITSIDYDKKKFSAILKTGEIPKEGAFHTGNLRIENGGTSKLQNRADALAPRQRLQFPISMKSLMDHTLFEDGEQRLECKNCGTSGSMGAAVEIDWWLFIPHSGFFEFWGENIGSEMEIHLKGTDLKQQWHQTLWRDGLHIGIPWLAEVGVGPEFGVGYDLEIQSAGTVTMKGEHRHSGMTYYKNCLWGCQDESRGWNDAADPIHKEVSPEMKFKAEVFLYAALAGWVTLCGKTWEAGVAALTPRITGQFEYVEGDDVCDTIPPYHHGLKEEYDLDVPIYAFAGHDPIDSYKWILADPTITLKKKCTGIGKPYSFLGEKSLDGSCGPDHEGRTCWGTAFGSCCSKAGWCGDTDDHCLYERGCRQNFGRCGGEDRIPMSNTDGKCGADYGTCWGTEWNGLCCSKAGYCGKTPDHCRHGCQVKYGVCYE